MKKQIKIFYILWAVFFIMGCIYYSFGEEVSKKTDVYLNGNNTVLLNVEINPTSVDTFTAAVIGKRVLLEADKTLYVLIASGGGFYTEGNKIIEFLKIVSNLTLICKYCASDAAAVFSSFLGPRLVVDESEILMHEMYLDHVTANMLKDTEGIALFLADSEDFNKTMYTQMNMSKEDYEQKIYNKSWTIKGKEIVNYKLADRIVTVSCDEYIKRLAPRTCGLKEK